jgi:hypothetical protein
VRQRRDAMGKEKQWLPLESNPEVMDAYVRGCVLRTVPGQQARLRSTVQR